MDTQPPSFKGTKGSWIKERVQQIRKAFSSLLKHHIGSKILTGFRVKGKKKSVPVWSKNKFTALIFITEKMLNCRRNYGAGMRTRSPKVKNGMKQVKCTLSSLGPETWVWFAKINEMSNIKESL